MKRLKEFEPIFYPKSVAVVGVSADEEKAGNQFLRAIKAFGFKGSLYLVNPDGVEILGLKTYTKVSAIPEPVDLVYVSTPAKSVPGIIEDCLTRGVRAVEIFTAGFGEVDEIGSKLEQEIVMLAKGRLRIIGPNCFGIYCPKGRLTLLPGARYPKENGSIALISQSGGLATHFIWAASGYGLRFSKVISYGNACDLNESDFLEYLAYDPEVKVIAAYIEGVKEGKRFFKLAKDIMGTKPLIIWKGGLTETGKRAVNSHTGSIAGEKVVWEAFSKQTGVVMVDNFEELLDVTAVFPHFPKGNYQRVAVVGGGGAVGVAASDTCEQVGLQVPILPDYIQEQLKAILPPAGTSIRNPIDVGAPAVPPLIFKNVLESILSWNKIDTLIIDRIFLYGYPQLSGVSDVDSEKRVQVLLDVKKSFSTPILTVLGELTTDEDRIDTEIERRRVQSRLLQAGIAVLPSLRRAAIAISDICSYYDKVSQARS